MHKVETQDQKNSVGHADFSVLHLAQSSDPAAALVVPQAELQAVRARFFASEAPQGDGERRTL